MGGAKRNPSNLNSLKLMGYASLHPSYEGKTEEGAQLETAI